MTLGKVSGPFLWEVVGWRSLSCFCGCSFKENESSTEKELPVTKLGLNLTLSKEKEKACRKYPRSNGSASSTSRRVQSGRGFRTSSGETHSDHKFNDISGFVGFILTVLFYVVYLIWAFVPDSYLHRIGVTWLPQSSGLWLFLRGL